MDVEAVELFTSLLAIVAIVGSTLLVLCRLLASRVALAREVGAAVSSVALPLAWLVAAVSMAGSLYFSEHANFTPCTLCWYQRICMYPLAIILFVAMLRKDRCVGWYAVPLAAAGASISVFHILEEQGVFEADVCDATVPCSVPWFEQFGFITLAVMALCGFVAIIVLLTVRFEER